MRAALLMCALGACQGASSTLPTSDAPAGGPIDPPFPSTIDAPVASPTISLPTANTAFDYQLGGPYAPPMGVGIVSRDRTAPIAPGLYNICYVNGFQSQPDEANFWLNDHPTLLLRDGNNAPVIDPDWPDEYILDISTATKRAELATIVGGWMHGCKLAGYQAIEIDNLDTYTRFGGSLTEAHAIAMMAELARLAHADGLAIAQKNSAEIANQRTALGTDFAVVEECNRYNECDVYTSAYGNQVYIIEYRQADYTKGCNAFPQLSIVLRDRNLVTPQGGAYVRQGC